MTTRNITVEYFAVLREHAGKANEQLSTSAATPADLYAELHARYSFPELQSLKVAINDEMADWSSPVTDGDTVLLFPPVAGG